MFLVSCCVLIDILFLILTNGFCNLFTIYLYIYYQQITIPHYPTTCITIPYHILNSIIIITKT